MRVHEKRFADQALGVGELALLEVHEAEKVQRAEIPAVGVKHFAIETRRALEIAALMPPERVLEQRFGHDAGGTAKCAGASPLRCRCHIWV